MTGTAIDALLARFPELVYDGPRPLELQRLVEDSRAAAPGCLFAAHAGRDPARLATHVADAVARGAAAVIAECERPDGLQVPWIRTPALRSWIGPLASELLGRPGERIERLLGVTGTNGKTTVATLLAAIAEAGEGRAGLIGTVEYRWAGQSRPADRTTPEASRFQELLAAMAGAGVRTVASEVSSHALDQDRVAPCRFAAAIFTNLTRDHFDYHRDFESYFAAKRRLFDRYLDATGVAVVNIDDEWGRRLAGALRPTLGHRLRTYAVDDGAADIRPLARQLDLGGIRCRLRLPPLGEVELDSQLLGRTNLSNLLAAAGAAAATGFSSAAIVDGIRALPVVPGRMQRVAPDAEVFVDYAHTPDALGRTLAAVRELSSRPLVVVFGCGGDRDRGKRAPMGETVGRLADLAIVTSDNPRSEDPLAIIGEIEIGLRRAGARFRTIPDRAAAIAAALREDAVVVIAGKGHETEQIFRDRTIAFSDLDVARAALEERQHA